MQRFVLEQNIALFERRLADAAGRYDRHTLRSLLLEARRQLTIFTAAQAGAVSRGQPIQSIGSRADRGSQIANRFRQEFEMVPHPSLLLDPGPGLHIVDINRAYAQSTMIAREAAAGQPLFAIFPDNPEDGAADGIINLYASLRIAAETRNPHAMEIQRYDVRNPDGNFVKRYWRPLNTPLFNETGDLAYLLHQVEDVTNEFEIAG